MEREKISIKQIIRFIKNIKNIFIMVKTSSPSTVFFLFVLNGIKGFITPLQLYIWKRFIDSVIIAIPTDSFTDPFFWLMIVSVVIILNNFLGRLCNYLQQMQVEYLNKYISSLLMERIDTLDMSYYDNAQTYDIIEKANKESITRSTSILTMLISLIRSLATLIGTISIIFILNPVIVILCLFSTIPMFYISVSISVNQYNIYLERVQKLRFIDHIKSLCSQYENLKELKIYRAIPYLRNLMISKFSQYINEDKVIRKNYLKKQTLTDLVQNILSYMLRGYILFTVIISKLTIGDLLMYINALENLEMSIRTILDTVASLYTDNLYIENLFILMDFHSNMENDKTLEFNGQFEKIVFNNVSFKYPNTDTYILKNINIVIHSQKVYALVGLNGSGKTTLIKLLMRLYDPTEGEILIDEINIKAFELKSLYRKIGVIFQDYIKYPLDVYDNIGIGNIENIADKEGIRNAAMRSAADRFIEKLPQKYNTYLQKEWDNGVELSIGQWQKLAISRAFTADSSILILDEPSASLDPKSEYELFHDIKKMIIGKTCLLITHRFANVKLTDEIFVISDGCIIESGTHHNLLEKKGLYSELYTMQAQSYEN